MTKYVVYASGKYMGSFSMYGEASAFADYLHRNGWRKISIEQEDEYRD